MNKIELINSLRASQSKSIRENRGLIHEFYGGGYGYSTSPEEQQKQNIEKRKKELEAKQIEQTGKKIEYQAPPPSSIRPEDEGRGPSSEVKVARDMVTDLTDALGLQGQFRSDVEKYLETEEGTQNVQNLITDTIKRKEKYKELNQPNLETNRKKELEDQLKKEADFEIKRLGWERPISTSVRLASQKLDNIGNFYAGEVKAGRMTGSQAAKQIQSASDQYQAREDEKFTQDMLKQGEEAAWTAADLAATGAMFATGVGAPAATARVAATGSRLARAGKAVQTAAKSTGKALTSGPWAGVGIDVAASGAAKANEKLTDDPELKQRYSNLAFERGMRAAGGSAFLAGIPAVIKGTQLAGKAVAPITPKVIKEPVKKTAELTGKGVTKLLSGNEAGQVAGGVIGNQIGGMMGGLGGSIVGGHIGTGAVKLFPALGKTVVPKRTGQILRNIGITKTK